MWLWPLAVAAIAMVLADIIDDASAALGRRDDLNFRVSPPVPQVPAAEAMVGRSAPPIRQPIPRRP